MGHGSVFMLLINIATKFLTMFNSHLRHRSDIAERIFLYNFQILYLPTPVLTVQNLLISD